MYLNEPYQFDGRGRTQAATFDDYVKQLVEQVLFTSPGERVNLPDFGSGLLQMVFAPNSPELAAALQFTTQAALQRYLGDLIDLRELQVTSDDARLNVTVKYAVRRTGSEMTETFVRNPA
jgi:phage baseplate assembly protein W